MKYLLCLCWVVYLVLSLPTNPGQFSGSSVATSPAIPAVRSAGRTVWIFRFPAILQKNPRTLQKLTRSPTSSFRKFCKKTLNFFRNQPAVQRPLSVLFVKKPQIFQKYNPPSKPSWAGLPLAPWASVGRIRPKAGLLYLLFFSNYE